MYEINRKNLNLGMNWYEKSIPLECFKKAVFNAI